MSASRITKGNMVIAQSGGPTAVINQSLVGAVLEAKRARHIGRIYGACHGIQGILCEDFIDLGRERATTLETVAATPSSALGSVRKKPTAEDCRAMLEVMKKYDVHYFFYIGGNDSAETAHIVYEEARKSRYDFRCFHICKTVDNDLLENDHCPGYGSAARFVASAFIGDNLDNRALPGVKINVIMGRHAGFLTAASALARLHPDDGPHLIYVPEKPFDVMKFVRAVDRAYSKYGRCIVAVSEGIVDRARVPIATLFSREVDSHGNVQLSGSGGLGDLLAKFIKTHTSITRVRADTFGYLQRSFPGIVSKVDAREAREVGRRAVRFATTKHASGSVAICRRKGSRYQVYYKRVPLNRVARHTRAMPKEYIHRNGCDVSAAFLDYVRPLVGPLPSTGRLAEHKVRKPRK